MLDILIGDCLITLSYGGGILVKGIQYYQKYFLRHPYPAWRSVHSEVVVRVYEDTVLTFSQTAPVAKYVTRNKRDIEAGLLGDNPRHALFRFHNYPDVVTADFIQGMLDWCASKAYRGGGIKRYWWAIYDFGQLLMYPINWVARLFGYTKHIAWLEKSGANVCSDAVASAYRKGLTRSGKQEDYIFHGIPSSEVTPSHFWVNKSRMFQVD